MAGSAAGVSRRKIKIWTSYIGADEHTPTPIASAVWFLLSDQKTLSMMNPAASPSTLLTSLTLKSKILDGSLLYSISSRRFLRLPPGCAASLRSSSSTAMSYIADQRRLRSWSSLPLYDWTSYGQPMTTPLLAISVSCVLFTDLRLSTSGPRCVRPFNTISKPASFVKHAKPRQRRLPNFFNLFLAPNTRSNV